MTKKIVFILLVLIFFLNKNSTKANVDSIINIFDGIPNSPKKIDSLISVINHLNNVDDSFILAEMAYTISLDLKDDLSKAKSLNALATYNKIKGQYAKALNLYNKELELREILKDKLGYAEATRLIGELYRANAVYENAISYTLKSVRLFDEIKDDFGLGRSYNRLAAIYFEIGPKSFDSVEKYANLSINYAKKVNNNNLAVSNYNLLASIYKEQNQLDKAIEEYNKALSYSVEYHLEYYHINILINLSDAHFKNKNYKKSIEFGLKAYKLSEETKILSYLLESTRLLKDVYAIAGDSANAYIYALKFLGYYKQNYDEEIAKVTTEQEAKFQNKEKQKDIERQKQEYQYLILISISVSIILILTIAFFYLKSNVLKRKNNLINEQKEKLQELNATKDKFFSIIAHDLKNPIGSFKAIAGMMNDELDDFTTEEIKEFTLLLKNSADNITELLENLLTWSKAQRNTISFTPEHNYIYQIVKHNFALLEPLAKNKNIKLINNIDQSDLAYCDGNMINTVIRNISTNSVKFTPSGGTITISSNIIERDNKKCTQISIADTGVGMSEETVNSLFKVGESRSTDGTAGEKGTGLGLIICKEFIDKHNGKIWAESKEGFGTTFYFSIPLK